MNHTNSHSKPRRRGIYLLPNLFTSACLFSGFYAIVSAMGQHFDRAALAIFVAMLMDGLDGRVARLTNTQTDFGAQYDSLSDVVSFGIAPALVMFTFSLQTLGKMGWLAAFIYAACTALRLARFNVQTHIEDKRYFIGLPCPSAAGVLAGLVWLGVDYDLSSLWFTSFSFLVTLGTAALMVSLFRYQSFKQLDLKGKVPFIAILLVVLFFALISIDPPCVLFLLFFAYGLSGPLEWLWKRVKRSTT